jgi:hypothetical protein
LHRARGGIVAGALFVLPSAMFILWALSWIYMAASASVPWLAAIFYGLKRRRDCHRRRRRACASGNARLKSPTPVGAGGH